MEPHAFAPLLGAWATLAAYALGWATLTWPVLWIAAALVTGQSLGD